MIWKKHPHYPEEGSNIIAIFDNEKIKRFFPMVYNSKESFSHVKKWCYRDEFSSSLNNALRMVSNNLS